MKSKGYKVELVTEFAKDLVQQGMKFQIKSDNDCFVGKNRQF